MPVVTNTPSAFEQQQLEYINRARHDPQGEFDALIADAATVTGVQDNITSAIRYFGVDLTLFRTQLDAFPAVAPLAWSGALATAADGHSQMMIDTETQAHELPGEATIGTRITDAGYSWSTYRENIYAYTQDPLQGHAGFYIDWGSGPGGMQDPAGHRISILSDTVTEIGISAIAAPNALSVGPWSVTQDFGNRWDYQPQLVGVVIDDGDGDRFYDMGEGLGNITITATGRNGVYTTTSWSSGGYQMVLPAGSYEVTFTGAGIDGAISYDVTMRGMNIKLDGIAGDAMPEVVEMVIRGDATDEQLVAVAGYDQTLIGNGGADRLLGSDGDNVLVGDSVDAAALPELAGQVYRLYLATLDREPDPTGQDNWTERLVSGEKTLLQVTTGFVNSPEFQATYGTLSNAGFVTLLYNNVLDRAPDATGLANWVARLEDGMSREEVVLGFSQSAEYISSTKALATAFSQEHSEAAWGDDVFRLYQATLDRVPDAGGFGNWSGRLADGMPYLDVAKGFVDSAEFQATYGALSNEGFVTLLYWNVLERAPDARGLANWTARLDAGMSRTEVVQGFAQSAEFVTATTPDYVDWMRGLGTDDYLSSGGGSDLMIGGLYSDTFAFVAGQSVTVADFEPWDMLELTGFGFANRAAAIAAFEDAGSDLALSVAGSDLVLTGLQPGDLSVDQIVLA